MDACINANSYHIFENPKTSLFRAVEPTGLTAENPKCLPQPVQGVREQFDEIFERRVGSD